MITPPSSAPLVVLAALAGLTSLASAGSTPLVPPVAPAPETSPRWVAELGTQFEFADETPAGPGGDIFRTRLAVPLFVPLSERWRLIGVLRGGWTDYASDPFGGEGLQTWNVGGLLTLNADINESWTGTVGVLGGGSWEDGASFSDSLNGGGLALLSYKFSPKLTVGLGGLYLTRLNEDALVVPALGLDWQASEALKITLYGLDLRAEVTMSSEWAVYLRGEFDPDGALLERRPGSEADSFNDQGFRAAGGLKWTPSPSFSLSLEGGVAFHEYSLRSSQEVELAKDRIDPAPFVGLSARLSF